MGPFDRLEQMFAGHESERREDGSKRTRLNPAASPKNSVSNGLVEVGLRHRLPTESGYRRAAPSSMFSGALARFISVGPAVAVRLLKPRSREDSWRKHGIRKLLEPNGHGNREVGARNLAAEQR